MRAVFCMLWVVGCGSSGIVEHPPSGTLDAIAWMHASWRATSAGVTTDEVWAPASERTWVGLNRTVEDGQVTGYEVLRMEVRGDGVRYVAAPEGQSVTAFALTRGGPDLARFENPDHDLPSWIQYQRLGHGASPIQAGTAITATIGTARSDEAAATWRFRHHGDAPPLIEHAGRVCRDGSTVEVTLTSCHCAAQLYCAGFETPTGVDLHVSVVEDSCDACSEVSGTCEVDGPITHVNGRAVAEPCTPGRLPVLLLLDL